MTVLPLRPDARRAICVFKTQQSVCRIACSCMRVDHHEPETGIQIRGGKNAQAVHEVAGMCGNRQEEKERSVTAILDRKEDSSELLPLRLQDFKLEMNASSPRTSHR